MSINNNIEMTDAAYHSRETLERENARWLAYQKEGLAPDKIVLREKDWAHASLKSAMINWHTCILYSLAGGALTFICAAMVVFLRDSQTARVFCGVSIVLGLAVVVVFGRHALRKPVLYKSRSWLLAEQQLNLQKKNDSAPAA